MRHKSTVTFQNKQAEETKNQGFFQPVSPVKKKKLTEENDDWLITYSDAVTLLLAFFVLILSVSEISQEKFEYITQGINKELLERENYKSPLNDLHESLFFVFSSNNINPDEALTKGDNFLKIELPSELLFSSASSELSEKSKTLLSNIADRIKLFPLDNFRVEIEGHSDDEPIHTTRFPSNWELSSSRAISVLKVFILRGVDNNKLKAVGYADTRPKVPNRDVNENPILENQKINRRVEIMIVKEFNQKGDMNFYL
ncbi:OmpA/MotB family protein [Thiomicrorhabdus sediminis]|uniref:Cell envelope biogenesis protein OmpA n=1 Tax=Thiomicrorhabdus sediminis TaxID=2580412 RepID=A0A4P9K524_9GAMM|nr:flagellar motor protein MotB [Thiomicrorhabdus sediminis]QCU89871.1 cell envelope biogenesis protein OmpA [Thiomicrorhabdus sediminis]